MKPFTLGPGNILALTEQQVATRQHSLVKTGEFYSTTTETQWAAGEVLGIDGYQPPAMLAYLQPIEPAEVAEKHGKRK